MPSLQTIAGDIWNLDVVRSLPVTESFGSDVALFEAADGNRYVVKNSFSPAKGQREVDALTALASHRRVPDLLDHRLVDDELYLLIEGLPGTPWTSIAGSSADLLTAVGRAVRGVHDVAFGSFDGLATWHDLVRSNADRYVHMIGDGPDGTLAERARAMLERHMPAIPNSADASLVQFDLRPGNILVDDGEFVALIDFESARGGHPSMDFFKLWQQVAPVVPDALSITMSGYLGEGPGALDARPDWTRIDRLEALMTIYSLYHGVAGLAWCHSRQDFSGDFPETNRSLIDTALRALPA